MKTILNPVDARRMQAARVMLHEAAGQLAEAILLDEIVAMASSLSDTRLNDLQRAVNDLSWERGRDE